MVCVKVKNLYPKFTRFSNVALGLIGILALGIPPATAINVGVTPPRIELKLDGGKTRSQSIRVFNPASEPIEIKAYVRSWTMSEDNRLQDIDSSEQSLDKWIVFTPSRFTIPARGSQTFRFSVRPKVQPQPGESRAVVYFEEILPVDPNVKGIRITGRIGVVIYGYVGDIKRVGVVNSVTVDTKPKTPQAIFDISSQGNGYVRLAGQYSIWNADKYPGAEATKSIANLGKPDAKLPAAVVEAGLLPDAPVLPNNRRQIKLPINKTLPPGNYVLDINGKLSGTPIDQGIPFTIPSVSK
jgi:hypothetical protein